MAASPLGQGRAKRLSTQSTQPRLPPKKGGLAGARMCAHYHPRGLSTFRIPSTTPIDRTKSARHARTHQKISPAGYSSSELARPQNSAKRARHPLFLRSGSGLRPNGLHTAHANAPRTADWTERAHFKPTQNHLPRPKITGTASLATRLPSSSSEQGRGASTPVGPALIPSRRPCRLPATATGSRRSL